MLDRKLALHKLLCNIFKPRKAAFCSPPASPPSPPPVSWILGHRMELAKKLASTKEPTPLASLYRMYEYLVAGFTTGLRSEIEFFFNRPSWPVADNPDPQDPDPERYTVLAVLPYYLVTAFNRLIERGLPRDSPAIIFPAMEAELRSPVKLEKVPSWVANVPKLEKTLIIPDDAGNVPRKEYWSGRFQEMRIIAEEPSVLFV